MKAVRNALKFAPTVTVTVQYATVITVALTVENALTVLQTVLASAKAVCFALTVL